MGFGTTKLIFEMGPKISALSEDLEMVALAEQFLTC